MLIVTRKLGEKIVIGEDIVVTVLKLRDGSVRLGVAAPIEVSVDRAEVRARKRAAKTETRASWTMDEDGHPADVRVGAEA